MSKSGGGCKAASEGRLSGDLLVEVETPCPVHASFRDGPGGLKKIRWARGFSGVIMPSWFSSAVDWNARLL